MEAARAALPADGPRLAELEAAALAEQRAARGGTLWALRDARRLPADPPAGSRPGAGATVLVGTVDEVVVGYAAAHVDDLPDESRLAVVDALYVEPGAREVGVGECLLAALVRWGEEGGCRGIDAVVLPGNRGAKNLFERAGLVARAITVHRALGPWADPGGAEPGS